MSSQAPQPLYQPAPPMPSYQPQMPKKKRRWLVPVLIAVALLVGVGMGSAKPAPDPVTITKEVEKRVELPPVKVEIPVTPVSCGRALELGAEINDISSKVVGFMSDSLTAAGNMDAATIVANSAKVREQTAKLKDLTPEFQLTRDTCRASLK